MVYLELLRVRRVFVWYAAILTVIALLVIYGAFVGNHVDFHSQVTENGTTHSVHSHGIHMFRNDAGIPIGPILAICGGFALLFGTFFAASFNRTSQHAHFTFVRPLSRYRMTLEVAGVDLAAIVVAQVFAIAMSFAAISIVGAILQQNIEFRWTGDTLAAGLLGLGCAFAWYAILQAVSAWTPERRGSGVFLGVGIGVLVSAEGLSNLTFLGPIFVDVFKAILLIDPIAYFASGVSNAGDATLAAFIPNSVAVRAAVVWGLAAVAIVLASVEWKRVEI